MSEATTATMPTEEDLIALLADATPDELREIWARLEAAFAALEIAPKKVEDVKPMADFTAPSPQ